MRHALALFLLFGSGCSGTGAAQPGRMLVGLDDPIVTVEAGNVRHGAVLRPLRYVVDRATQTCWIQAGTELTPLGCCAARRVPELATVITWETDASCEE